MEVAIGRFLILLGLTVELGYAVEELEVLTHLYPGWVTMKPVTALGFIIAGIGLAGGGKARVWTSSALMLLYAALLGMAVSDAGFRRPSIEIATEGTGEPSMATMSAFVFTGAGLLLNEARRVVVWVLSLVAGCALVGYVASYDPLRWRFEGYSTGMAAHTALAFGMVAWALSRARGASGNPHP